MKFNMFRELFILITKKTKYYLNLPTIVNIMAVQNCSLFVITEVKNSNVLLHVLLKL